MPDPLLRSTGKSTQHILSEPLDGGSTPENRIICEHGSEGGVNVLRHVEHSASSERCRHDNIAHAHAAKWHRRCAAANSGHQGSCKFADVKTAVWVEVKCVKSRALRCQNTTKSITATGTAILAISETKAQSTPARVLTYVNCSVHAA